MSLIALDNVGRGEIAGDRRKDGTQLRCGAQRKEGARKDGSKVWDKQRVDSFPVVSEAINRLMAEVIEGVRDVKALRHKLFQAAFHVTLSGEAMVCNVLQPSLGPRPKNQTTDAQSVFLI
jgi:tRNA/tmRNA/rRNA uracil-C5-methylase (TrmA/RlmC/RlmD family)